MILDHGHQVFYGPPSEARAYFEDLGYKSLPRQSTPDYLTGCTDPNERQFASGRSSKNVPSTPEDLERTFIESSHGNEVTKALNGYTKYMAEEKADQDAFRAAVAADKRKGVSKASPYTRGYVAQTKAVTIRLFQQKLQDRFFMITSFLLSILLALVIGGAFFNQQLTAQGAFVRGR